MKKFLLLSLIGITLVACGKKKITNEMLVGEWSCHYNDLRAPWKDGQFLDYINEQNGSVKVHYYMQDNTLMMSYNDNSDHASPFNLDELLAMNGIEEIVSNLKTKNIVELNYISNDEFNFNEIQEVTYLYGTNAQEENYNVKLKSELSCKRIQ